MDACDSGRQVSLQFSGGQPLRAVLVDALAALARLELDADIQARAAIIVEELLANLFEHGGLGPGGTIRLELGRKADSLRLTLCDTGPAFDPRLAVSDAPVPERGGGAGLRIVQTWAEILSYEPGPPLNRLLLRIPLT
jgi:anti-sigma regulatory factor (Ser/Thr protein kinase)